MSIVVSDTSPVRALANLGLLPLLDELFELIWVPPAVTAELLRGPPPVDIRSIAVARVRQPAMTTRLIDLKVELDPGEAEAIALALEIPVREVLIDEAHGRAIAQGFGLRAVGVFGVLQRAKEAGKVTAIRPLLDRLQREFTFFISDELRARVLRNAGE